MLDWICDERSKAIHSIRKQVIPRLLKKQFSVYIPVKDVKTWTPNVYSEGSNGFVDNMHPSPEKPDKYKSDSCFDFIPIDGQRLLLEQSRVPCTINANYFSPLRGSKYQLISCFAHLYQTNPPSLTDYQQSSTAQTFFYRINNLPAFIEVNRLHTKISPYFKSASLRTRTLSGRESTFMRSPSISSEIKKIGNDSVVGEESVVSDKAIIKRSVIGKNCHIGEKAHISNSVVLDGVSIEPGAVIHNSLICSNVYVTEKSEVKDSVLGFGLKLEAPEEKIDKETLIAEDDDSELLDDE